MTVTELGTKKEPPGQRTRESDQRATISTSAWMPALSFSSASFIGLPDYGLRHTGLAHDSIQHPVSQGLRAKSAEPTRVGQHCIAFPLLRNKQPRMTITGPPDCTCAQRQADSSPGHGALDPLAGGTFPTAPGLLGLPSDHAGRRNRLQRHGPGL